MAKEKFETIGSFVFTDELGLFEKLKNWLFHGSMFKPYEDQALELMSMHLLFYDEVHKAIEANSQIEEEYALRGAKLVCTHGNKVTYLDTFKDHGGYKDDYPIMTCEDCKVGENIYDFLACGNDQYEPVYSQEAPHPSEEVSIKGINRYRCIPILTSQWGTGEGESRVYINSDSDDNTEYVKLLLIDATLRCLYGGIITIKENPEIEIPSIVKQENVKYVVLPKKLNVRKEPSADSDKLTIFEAGQRVNVILNGNDRVEKKDSKGNLWVEIELENDETGWVNDVYILPDAPVETIPPGKVVVYIDGKEIANVDISKKWGIAGSGGYSGMSLKTNEGYYNIAVGPKILNPKYQDDEKVQQDDFLAFSRIIDIELVNKSGQTETKRCYECDLKAHSYNKYPDGHSKTASGISSAEARGDSGVMESGIVQTGIRYPNASNSEVVARNNADGSIIEFCANSVDFNISDYQLVKVIAYLKEEGEV